MFNLLSVTREILLSSGGWVAIGAFVKFLNEIASPSNRLSNA